MKAQDDKHIFLIGSDSCQSRALSSFECSLKFPNPKWLTKVVFYGPIRSKLRIWVLFEDAYLRNIRHLKTFKVAYPNCRLNIITVKANLTYAGLH